MPKKDLFQQANGVGGWAFFENFLVKKVGPVQVWLPNRNWRLNPENENHKCYKTKQQAHSCNNSVVFCGVLAAHFENIHSGSGENSQRFRRRVKTC